MEHALSMVSYCGNKDLVEVSVIDADKLAKGGVTVLRMRDELREREIAIESRFTSGWANGIFGTEVLAVGRIPGDCILETFKYSDTMAYAHHMDF